MNLAAKTFLGAVTYFAGGPKQPWSTNEKGNTFYSYEQVFMKGKSDYLYQPMSEDGMLALFEGQRRHPDITTIFDGYGGKIGTVQPEATAFAHRKALASVQYVSQFNAAVAASRLSSLKEFHDGLRAYFSGHAYVNYPDLDLGERYGEAYWGENFARLKKIKAAFDPAGLLNPGKIVRASRMDDRALFRYPPGYAIQPLRTGLDWSAWNVQNDPVTETLSAPGSEAAWKRERRHPGLRRTWARSGGPLRSPRPHRHGEAG